MKGLELYGQVRRAVYVEGLSRRLHRSETQLGPLSTSVGQQPARDAPGA
jgi:hypothetical protein